MRAGMLLLLATAMLVTRARPSFAQTAAAQAAPPVPASPPAAAPPVPYRPRLIIELDLGLDQGGDDLGDGIRAGQGVVFSGLGSVTPLWIQHSVGLGAGLAFGWKYSGVGDRVPVAAFGQALLSLGGRWFSPLRAGPMKLVSTGMPSDWGFFVDWGVCRWFEDRMALAILLRYTHLDLNRQGAKIDADSFGVALGAAFGD